MNSSISRESVLKQLDAAERPVTLPELVHALGGRGKTVSDNVLDVVRELIGDGLVVRNRRNRFALARRIDMEAGRVVGHRDGYGFVVVDDGRGADLFLSPREMKRVFHGDRVLARVTSVDQRGRREGRVAALIDSPVRHVVGRLSRTGGTAFLVPEDNRIQHDLVVDKVGESGAVDGQIVVAEVLGHPFRDRHPGARIIEVLGDHMAPGMEIEIAIRKHDLPHRWPAAVTREIKGLGRKLRTVDPESWRRDLRELPLVTIDGADARDFDDAVYCERAARGWRLVVAIADVSHYVGHATALDAEARGRGTSVYFPDRVVPMLPEDLSNGICSLNPDEDRLALVCDMAIDGRGEIGRFRFYSAVIRSHARLTYDQVAAVLAGSADPAAAARTAEIERLHELFGLLHEARSRNGRIDLDLPEADIRYDENGRIETIARRARNDAHRIIEECMLAANRCAAEFLAERFGKAMYRVHERPDPLDVAELRRFLGGLGIDLGGGDRPQAADYQQVIAAAEGFDEATANLLQTVLLRSMRQAMYASEPGLHFALNFEHYTHFTSPIRRYPDLVVHRLVKSRLRGEKHRSIDVDQDALFDLADHCSFTERRADDASRDVVQWLKAEFMQDRVGDEFDGVISGVTEFGIFVQLREVFVDGLVHVSELGNDYYHFDPARYQLVGERSAVRYRLGDAMRVRVARVDVDEAKIDFVPADKPHSGGGRRPKSGKRQRVKK